MLYSNPRAFSVAEAVNFNQSVVTKSLHLLFLLPLTFFFYRRKHQQGAGYQRAVIQLEFIVLRPRTFYDQENTIVSFAENANEK